MNIFNDYLGIKFTALVITIGAYYKMNGNALYHTIFINTVYKLYNIVKILLYIIAYYNIFI